MDSVCARRAVRFGFTHMRGAHAQNLQRKSAPSGRAEKWLWLAGWLKTMQRTRGQTMRIDCVLCVVFARVDIWLILSTEYYARISTNTRGPKNDSQPERLSHKPRRHRCCHRRPRSTSSGQTVREISFYIYVMAIGPIPHTFPT